MNKIILSVVLSPEKKKKKKKKNKKKKEKKKKKKKKKKRERTERQTKGHSPKPINKNCVEKPSETR